MALVLIEAPSVEPVTVAELKAHARITIDAEDTLVANYIAAARQKLDGRDGLLGRALVTQRWQLKLDSFPAEIIVPLPPCQSIDSITYLDTAGDEQTLASSAYVASDLSSENRARVTAVGGTSWPATKAQNEAVTVSFTAGYAASGSPPDLAANVPEPIKEAIRLWATHFYDERHATVVAGTMREMPLGVDELIADYRIREF